MFQMIRTFIVKLTTRLDAVFSQVVLNGYAAYQA
jgi:hypothetical protein